MVGFSPGNPHAGRSFRLLQSEAIDFGSGDARAGLLAVYTLGVYKLGLWILNLETHFWTAGSLHSVRLQFRETDFGSVDAHASRGSFNVSA